MTGDIEAARDLSQDVFVKAFEKLGGFDFRHRFFSWIYRIAINEAIDWNRKSKPTERLDKVEHLLPDIPDSRDMEIQSILLHRELRRLEANYRVLILLKYYCGLSYDEIADATRIPVKKIRSRLFIARQQLRTGLISHGFFENDR
jgi:RNA polymerase sigma-70 factor (ECF subfamily)